MNELEKLKAIEADAKTIELDTLGDLMTKLNEMQDVELQTQVLRCFRAAIAFNARGEVRQHFAERHGQDFLSVVEGFFLNCDSESKLCRARCCLQVLVSASADSEYFREAFIKNQRCLDAAFNCLHNEDQKLKRFCTILVKLYLEKKPDNFVLTSRIITELLNLLESKVEDGCAADSLAALHLAFQNSSRDIQDNFDNLLDQHKHILLDILHEWPKTKELNEETVQMVARLFKDQSTMLLTTFKSGQSAAEPGLTLKLLGLLCDWTASDENVERRKQIQNDTSVLIDAIYLLKMIHKVGNEGKNKDYAPVRKISELDKAHVEENPVFGFKRDLVRLTGNMCWRHRKNQDTVCESNGIPLLLDCSPIDANNPIMMQWVVFALRNLCEGNEENQKVISSIDKHGTTTAQLAEEFGVMMKTSE